ILVSLSKGGAEIKMALKEPDAKECFRMITAWLNVGGILEGSPMIKWLFRRKFRTLLYRLIFAMRKQDFGMIQALQHGMAGSLGFTLEVPKSWEILHVAGFPLHRHMSSPRAERWRHRLSKWGPNDSVLLLTELEKLPGLVYPVWGTDHYLQSQWEVSNLVRSLLNFIGMKQNLVQSF
ncbi:MAG: hypothetical protein KDA84_17710, partial [Planctomycetaceae bacterium]|nr:hypothetical protein [Planctomycetaceae bacterium]